MAILGAEKGPSESAPRVQGVAEQRITYAQNGEDVRVWRALGHLPHLFYVEVGAYDPFEGSVTAGLSALGASGVLVEPDPQGAERLRQARGRDVVVPAAASDRPGLLAYFPSEQPGCARVGDVADAAGSGTLAVPAVRLADVLDELRPPEVHFLSVDVEGHEAAVLRGADLGRWRPWVLCVEATEPNSRRPSHEAWEPEVLAAGYSLVAFDGLNRWYLADEHPEIEADLAQPFGVLDRVLDGWVPAEMQQLRERAAAAEEEVRRLQQEQQALEERATEAGHRLDELGRRLDDRETALRLAEDETAGLRSDVTTLAAELDRLAEEHHRVIGSRSWRATQPLRSALWLGRSRSRPAGRRVGRGLLAAGDAVLARNPELRAKILDELVERPALADRLRRWRSGPPAVASVQHDGPSLSDVRRAAAVLVVAERFGADQPVDRQGA
jgi:FkbM family methyltransferase